MMIRFEGILSVGLKNEQRRTYIELLRSPVKLLEWDFAQLTYPSYRPLTFTGDPRDVDKVTQLMVGAVDKLVRYWESPVNADEDDWDQIRVEFGPMPLKIADDTPGSRSFWKRWTMLLAREHKSFYRFLEENHFSYPPGGVTIDFIAHEEGEVPYIRIK